MNDWRLGLCAGSLATLAGISLGVQFAGGTISISRKAEGEKKKIEAPPAMPQRTIRCIMEINGVITVWPPLPDGKCVPPEMKETKPG